MTSNMSCELLGAAGITWGLMVGTIVGCMLRLRYDESNYKNIFDTTDAHQNEIEYLQDEISEKDEQIKNLSKKIDMLVCDTMANDRLIKKLKDEYSNVMKSLSDTLNRTNNNEMYTTVPPPLHIRKRQRGLSHESDDIHPDQYRRGFTDTYTWSQPNEKLDKDT
jgi:uncharacterized membrane-anchored protein YhcB (DUF1043 family)